MNHTMKHIYSLDYDNSNFSSGLGRWYNSLIDKSVDELNIVDVSKMIRQNILKEVAVEKAIDIFLLCPFEGEMQDGDLLSLLVSHGCSVIKSGYRRKELKEVISHLESNDCDFDWMDTDDKKAYKQNIATLKQLINT